MRRFRCYFCGHVHDEAAGDPDGGVPPGTRFEDVADDWRCPMCGADKDQFHEDEAGGDKA